MAVSTVEPLLKSTPDVSKINGFTGCIVTVTKHTAARNAPGTSVVATQAMSKEALFALQISLPLANGPGYYRFSVTDAGGSGDDLWGVKLGPDFPQEVTSMAGPTGLLPPGAPPPTGEDVVNLGHGFYHNRTMGTLTTPWRKIYNWREGEPFPEQPAGATPLQSVPPNATPWNWPPQQQGWGGYPVQDDRTKLLETQLADERRQREQETIRAEMRAQAEATQRRFEQQQQQFTALIEKLAAKPAGPSETEQRMERQLAEERAKREESERESRRREEDRRREEQHRAEMLAMNEKFDRALREMAGSKTDPMLPMLMQMFTTQQQGAMEAVKSIQAAMSTAASASERQTQQMLGQLQNSVMSPIQIAQLMQQSQGAGAEGARALVGAMREAMDTQKTVFQQLLEIAGEGGQPAWVGVVNQAIDKAGVIGQAIAERAERQAAQQAAAAAQAARQQPRTVYVQQPANGVARTPGGGIPQPAMTTGVPAIAPQPPQQDANDTGVRPAGTEYDAAKDEFVLSNGQRISVADVTRDGWRKSLAELQKRAGHAFPPAPIPMQVVPVLATFPPAPGTPPSAPVMDVQLADAAPAPAAPPPAVAPPRGKGRKKGKPADPAGFTAREMRGMDAAVVRDAIASWTDDTLFGPLLLPHVITLRNMVPPPDPAEVAKNVMEARTQLGQANQAPPAMELFDALQFEVLVMRLFPAAPESYHILVVEALEAATNTGTDDDEDDEDETDDA